MPVLSVHLRSGMSGKLILCAYYTGLRLRDCSELRWNAIDWQAETITVTTRKTRKTVVVPIHPQFAAWLKRQTRGIGKAPVFPTLAGKSGSGKSGLSMAFRRIMDRAQIKGRILREANGAGRSQSSLSFHSLRHSFNAALANAGVGVEMRQELVGHSSVEMNRKYTHTEMELKRKAIALSTNPCTLYGSRHPVNTLALLQSFTRHSLCMEAEIDCKLQSISS